MKNKVSQVRITIPKWIVKLKEWEIGTHLEFVPLIKDDDKPITKETVFIIKEVK
ncbi:MAG: hypothetical protein Q8N99_08795 [Nanoarchaeota archaeon]|nr:hypothetical protein [Nanoarchaeota archaeon]